MNIKNERKDILFNLGFKYDKQEARHYHSLIGRTSFDFSASSIEGIVYMIFRGGYNIGQSDLKDKFHELFKMEEQ